MGEYVLAKDLDKAKDILGAQLNAIKKEVKDWSNIILAYDGLVWDQGMKKKFKPNEIGE